MVQCLGSQLDASFAARSHPTRRSILVRLAYKEAPITDLAETYHMTLTGMKQHAGVLEQTGFVTTENVDRVHTCKLVVRSLEAVAAWIDWYRQF